MAAARKLLACFYKAGVNTICHDGVEHAGYLAFLALLSLFPFLVFVTALAGFLAQGKAGMHFVGLILAQLPPDMVQALKPRINEIASGPPQGLLTVSILGVQWTASSALEGYRTILNRAYNVSTPPAYIWRRLLSIFQVLVLSFVVIVAMIALVALPLAWEKLAPIFGSAGVAVSRGLVALISLAAIFGGVSAVYYYVPNLKQRLGCVLPGAVLSTVLWVASARLLSLYLSRFSQVNLVYGSLGGVIATLIFFYINNIIFIYGAEFNHLIKVTFGENAAGDDGQPNPRNRATTS
jgi:membrane protein